MTRTTVAVVAIAGAFFAVLAGFSAAGWRGRFKLPADARFAQELALGDRFACARMKDASARCFGTGDAREGSVRVALDVKVAHVAAGGDHACALTTTGEVWCWRAGHTKPARVAIDHAAEVAIGARRACARKDDGTVMCWGAGELDARPVAGVKQAIAIAAGGETSCVIGVDRGVRCWGDAGEVARLEGLPRVMHVAVGGAHACAIAEGGALYCWGKNADGQLGDGTTLDRVAPVRVPNVTATAVALGRAHSCALLADSSVRCWGANGASQLADGTHEGRGTPALVPGLMEVVEIAASSDASCARFDNGSERCWGEIALPKMNAERMPVPMEVRW